MKKGGNIHDGKQPGNGRRTIMFYLSEELHSRVLERARGNEQTLSELTRTALKEYLAKAAQ